MREIHERLRFLDERRHRLPLAGPRGGDAVGRRGAADPPRDADRLGARRRALRPRRALDRPAPARQRAAGRRRSSGCATSATRCSSSSTTSRRCAPPTTSSTSARAPASTAGGSSRRARRPRSSWSPESLTGQFLSGAARIEVPARAAHAERRDRDPRRHRSTTCEGIDVRDPARGADLRHRRVGLGQVDARQRHALQGGREPAAPRAPAARRAPRACAASRRSTRSSPSTSRRSGARRARTRRPTPASST